MSNTQSSELEQILGEAVARGVDASSYLIEDPKKFNEIFGGGIKTAIAAIEKLMVRERLDEQRNTIADGEGNVYYETIYPNDDLTQSERITELQKQLEGKS